MLCAISDETPQEPVVSRKTGHIFEKRLVEKHIATTGSCPVTGDALTVDDLLPLVAATPFKPRPANLASMPALLQTVQNEWDAVMLETYQLKQQLVETRKNLAKALYENDAAFRVIARLIQERDEARSMIAQMEGVARAPVAPAAPASSDAGAMEVDTKEDAGDMTEDIKARLEAHHAKLSKGRKKRIKARARETASADSLRTYVSESFTPHSTSPPGITCIDLHPTQSTISVSGGNDSNVVLFDRKEGKIVNTLKGHRKKLTSVAFVGETSILSSSADTTAILWGISDGTKRYTVDEVQCVALHPSGEFFVTGSTNKSWTFHDIASGRVRQRAQIDLDFGVMAFHPDGKLVGASTTNNINVMDASTFEVRAKLPGHRGNVISMAFSQNGYTLATGDDQGTVKLWDLRNVQCMKTISDDSKANSVSFDASHSYLAVGGSDISVYSTSSWDLVNKFSDHRSEVTSVQFGAGANFFASTSLDRTVKFWSPQ
jgi:pre-mRNA-processing factor 19